MINAIFGQVVLGCIRKHTEQAMRGLSVSSVLPWPLHHRLPLGSCLTSIHDGLQVSTKINLLFTTMLLVTVIFTPIETLARVQMIRGIYFLPVAKLSTGTSLAVPIILCIFTPIDFSFITTQRLFSLLVYRHVQPVAHRTPEPQGSFVTVSERRKQQTGSAE